MVESALSADVTMTTAATFYDGPSVNVTAGTWLLIGNLTAKGSTTNERMRLEAKLWDGTTVLASGTTASAAVSGITSFTSVPVCAVRTATGNETWKISGAGAANNQLISAAVTSGNTASYLRAIRIGP